jgi:hypothetical protein
MQATGSKRQHLSTGPPAAARALAGHDSAGRVGLISVIIVAYNEAAAVERTISSTGETAAIVQRLADTDYRITLLRKPGSQVLRRRN